MAFCLLIGFIYLLFICFQKVNYMEDWQARAILAQRENEKKIERRKKIKFFFLNPIWLLPFVVFNPWFWSLVYHIFK